jgi:cytochrome c biogenesis protein CcmG/thiol:disulfide interchange protein DsbE
MRRLIALAPFALFAALVFVFGAYALHHNPQVVPRAMVGKAAPDDALPSLDGAPPAPLRAALKGPTLVNFFAAWCATCPQEAGTLSALQSQGSISGSPAFRRRIWSALTAEFSTRWPSRSRPPTRKRC